MYNKKIVDYLETGVPFAIRRDLTPSKHQLTPEQNICLIVSMDEGGRGVFIFDETTKTKKHVYLVNQMYQFFNMQNIGKKLIRRLCVIDGTGRAKTYSSASRAFAHIRRKIGAHHGMTIGLALIDLIEHVDRKKPEMCGFASSLRNLYHVSNDREHNIMRYSVGDQLKYLRLPAEMSEKDYLDVIVKIATENGWSVCWINKYVDTKKTKKKAAAKEQAEAA